MRFFSYWIQSLSPSIFHSPMLPFHSLHPYKSSTSKTSADSQPRFFSKLGTSPVAWARALVSTGELHSIFNSIPHAALRIPNSEKLQDLLRLVILRLFHLLIRVLVNCVDERLCHPDGPFSLTIILRTLPPLHSPLPYIARLRRVALGSESP